MSWTQIALIVGFAGVIVLAVELIGRYGGDLRPRHRPDPEPGRAAVNPWVIVVGAVLLAAVAAWGLVRVGARGPAVPGGRADVLEDEAGDAWREDPGHGGPGGPKGY